VAKSCITSLLRLLLKNGDFLNIDISQGSVATRLGCGGVFICDCYKFPTESNTERILKIGQHLVKLWARVRCLIFLTHSVYTYMVGQKIKLLILSEYVNKTEKIGGMWTKKNTYRENEVLSDIFTSNILRHNCFMFKYSMTERNQWNYCWADTN